MPAKARPKLPDQLIVGTDSQAVSKGVGNYWQTGQVNSSAQLVNYEGQPLQPFTKYYYAVKVWDYNKQASPLSAVNSFETGMMHMGNWRGAWISDSRDITVKPAPYFRKTFTINKKIKSARAYIAVAGLYELYFNGVKDRQPSPRSYVHAVRQTHTVPHP